jgi:hypothetical protein
MPVSEDLRFGNGQVFALESIAESGDSVLRRNESNDGH